MNRRTFLASSSVASLASAIDLKALTVGGQDPAPSQEGAGLSDLRLLKGLSYKPYIAQLTYNPSPEAGAKPPTPNALMLYDTTQNKFVSPLSISPTLDKGEYTIASTLRSFNISTDNYSVAQKSQQEVQLGLNFTATMTSAGDKFELIAKNAVDIFLQKGNQVATALSSFKSANPQTAATPTNKVQVLKGTFDLQVNAFFQKKQGFWSRLIHAIGRVPGSPLLATLGIPGVALEALDFVMYSLDKLTNGEQLTPIWNPNPLTFALTKDAKGLFKFQEGLWLVIDSDVLSKSDLLKDYKIDLLDETYKLLDNKGNPVNANYVVTDFTVTSGT
jgi:hypothetical protein